MEVGALLPLLPLRRSASVPPCPSVRWSATSRQYLCATCIDAIIVVFIGCDVLRPMSLRLSKDVSAYSELSELKAGGKTDGCATGLLVDEACSVRCHTMLVLLYKAQSVARWRSAPEPAPGRPAPGPPYAPPALRLVCFFLPRSLGTALPLCDTERACRLAR